jgi:hypothetical protein
VVLALVLPVLGLSCGPGAHDVDQAAQYTPESLAQELAFSYRSLQPEAKKSTRQLRRKSKADKTIADLERDERAEKKGGGTEVTKKRTGPPTVDDVLEDVDRKLDLIRGVARSDACRKMSETISNDPSLTDSDKKLLSEKLKELSEAS